MAEDKRASSELVLIDPELPQGGGVRLGTLVTIRWMAVAGQLLALIFVGVGLGFDVKPHVTVPVVLTSALMNLWFTLKADRNSRLTDVQSSLQLAFDLIHLSVLLFVTGGLANPFSVLMLAPTSVSASILGRQTTRYLIVLAIMLVTALAFTPFPLPWNGPPPGMDPLVEAGLWTSLCFALIFLTGYMARVGREGRHRARALAATQIALEREQRLAALGTLAAAAAHELGTPLGTILLAARDSLETLQERGGDAATRADLELIVSEATRCRNILAELRQHRQTGTDDHFAFMPLEAILREAAAPHEGRGVDIWFVMDGDGELVIRRVPEMVHAVRNLCENAVGYAHSYVLITANWDSDKVRLTVDDDGPGFDPQVIRRLGEPYVTTRHWTPGQDGGLGLGLFIAKTLLERTGATVAFRRAPAGGARVRVEWPRGDMEEFADAEKGEKHDG